MATPVRITFRDIPPSAAVREAVEKKLEKLAAMHRIIGGEVAIEAPHRHQHQGMHYRVRIDLQVPGRELAVGRDPAQDSSHEDVYVAIRDAFAAIHRLLEKHQDRSRSVKRQRARVASRLSRT